MSTGYHVDLGHNYFLEPSAGLSITRTKFDSLPFLSGDGTLAFNEVKSELGRVGARVGTAFTMNNIVWSPFATMSVWHEFENAATAQALVADAVIPVSTTRVGTFYQASGGLSFQLPSSGILGFVRGDGRWGENLQGWTVLGGGRATF